MSNAPTSGHNARDPRAEILEPSNRAADLWLAERICGHTGIREALFRGCLDDPAQRRERLRAAILDNGLGIVVLGKHGGKPENYAQHFRRRFGVEL